MLNILIGKEYRYRVLESEGAMNATHDECEQAMVEHIKADFFGVFSDIMYASTGEIRYTFNRTLDGGSVIAEASASLTWLGELLHKIRKFIFGDF